MLKKIIALVLVLCSVTSVAYAGTFYDTQGHWADEDIKYAVENGIVNGYEDGSFKPNEQITRAEYTKMLIAAFAENFNIDLEDFDDKSHWASKYNNYAKQYLFYIDKSMVYDDVTPALLEGENYDYPIRRWEMAYMLCSSLVNAFDVKAVNTDYTDKELTLNTYGELIEQTISTCIGIGMLKGDQNANFNASKNATRAEAVTIIARLDRRIKESIAEKERQEDLEKEMEDAVNSMVKEYTQIPEGNPKVKITMENGKSFIIELYPEYAPQTVANFVSLVEAGFYDGLTFHRIVDGFMAQGGDPEGNGMGGAEHNIFGEFSANGFTNNTLSHERGVVSMARTKYNNSASSQFFICFEDAQFLDGQYASFGKVIDGMDVVDDFLEVERIDDGSGEKSYPVEKIMINKAEIIK